METLPFSSASVASALVFVSDDWAIGAAPPPEDYEHEQAGKAHA
ncbi:hypothetical protein [Desulforhopalus sp. 52FAK]